MRAQLSFATSQKQLWPVCTPAPFFCIKIQVTTYLKGLFICVSFCMLWSQMRSTQVATFDSS